MIPISEKALLTPEEAAEYANIGVNKIRELAKDRNCDFLIMSGRRMLIKRKRFEKWLEMQEII